MPFSRRSQLNRDAADDPWLGCIFVFLLCITAAVPASAQSGTDASEQVEAVEPTDEQARLNDQGVRAISEGDYVKAITLLEEARYIGELNITLLNLGRAYQLAGRCQKARQVLEQVPTAPQVPRPAAGLVESKAQEYLQVLSENCESTGTTDPIEPPRRTSNTFRNVGIASTTVGGAVLLSAAGMHFLWAEQIRDRATEGLPTDEPVTSTTQRQFYEDRDRANAIDTAALGSAIFGGVLTGVGLYFWLSNSGTESTSQLRLSPSSTGIRATWTLRF